MGHVSNHEIKEAYECGYEEGYEDAMREFEGKSTHGRMRRY
jgi:phosphoenolpyruvate carboxylase